VDNKPEELFSIMQWVDPEVLGRWDLFDAAYIVRDEYGRPKRYRRLDVLRKRLEPALARISHDDPRVQGFIPKAIPSEVMVPLSGELRPAFIEIATDLYDALKRVQRRGGFDLAAYYSGNKQGDENSVAGQVMAMLGAIDLLLAHPDLLVMSGQQYADSQARKAAGEERAVWPGSKYAWTKWQQGLVDDLLDSPKLDKLAERVPAILAEDPDFKVLVYTRQRGILPYMKGVVPLSVEYHGGMDARAKTAAVARFTQDPQVRVFLSSHAGARGTNLYKASHLINYDVPWAAGIADQINGRHVRASSAFKQVWIENFLVEDTTDMWKFHSVLGVKRQVGSAILDGKGSAEIRNEGNGLMAFLAELLDRL
jgi:SNF2 family DNA or RNA helicase